jgi:hypothetical protein
MRVLFIPVGSLGPFRKAVVTAKWHTCSIARGATEVDIGGGAIQGRKEATMKAREAELGDNSVIKTEEIIKSICN